MFKKPTFQDVGLIEHEHIVAGRVSRHHCKSTDNQGVEHSATFWNIHNFELANPERKLINERILQDKRKVDAAPTQHTLWVVGDFNFPQEGKHEYAIRRPDQPKSHVVNHVRWQRAERKGWFALGELTEVTAAGHSHFWQPNQTYSAIDRIFVGAPNWMFLRLQGDARVVGDPAKLVARRTTATFSDSICQMH